MKELRSRQSGTTPGQGMLPAMVWLLDRLLLKSRRKPWNRRTKRKSRKSLKQDAKNEISDETIEYVGILAKLELNEEEKEHAKKDMEEMLNYIDKLNELDTTGVEPMSHVFPVNNVFREDVVTNGDGSKETLSNAPAQKDGGFKVPKTIGD